tara:strand:+ start:382 stop:663 length:282 start_codon:yes stop_codon:yes gene_type:complete
MKYHLISTKDSTSLIELMNNYTITELGTSWNINGNFYQSFIGEPKLTPKVTEDKPEVTKEPKLTPKVTKAPKKKKPAKKTTKKEIKNVPDVSK